MNRSRVTGDLASHGNIFVDIANDRVGIGSTIPTQKLEVTGTVKATAFAGDGSSLTGVNVVDDTTPQLGGNLDVNGKDIISTSNGDIDFTPNGTGAVVFKGVSSNGGNGAGRFKLNCEQNSHGITIQGPPHSAGANYTLTLPNNDGSSGQFLQSNGSGVLSFATVTTDLVADTSPQLGGNLDVQSSEITTSTSNGNIKLTPNGSGFIEIKGASGNDGTLQLNCSANSHGVKIKSPPHSAGATYTLTLPNNDGSNGQFLQTNGSGVLSFATVTTDLVADTSPQLGGDLDVQASKVTTSTSNGNIKLEPNGTGVVEVRGAGGNDGTLQLNCSAQSHGIKLKSPPHSAAQSYTLTFPSSIVNNGALKTDSSGNLSFGLIANANIDASAAIAGSKISPDFGSQDIVTTGHIDLPDDAKLKLGTGDDLSIFHDGSNSIIYEQGTGNLAIQSTGAEIQLSKGGSFEHMVRAIVDGAVVLYHDGSKKFETTSSGVAITGNLEPTGNTNIPDSSSGSVGRARFGNGADLQIYHDGVHSRVVDTGTGNLILQGSIVNLQNVAGTENMIKATQNGAVELYHDNSTKLETTSAGATVTGALTTNNGGGNAVLGSHLDLGDNQKVRCGASDDLQIYHDGSHSYIQDSGTGNLKILGSKVQLLNADGSEEYLHGINGGAVKLRHNNVVKFETTSDGATVTGSLTATGGFSGSGASLSGVNAATLDSIDSSQFLRSDANDTMSGRLTLTSGSAYPLTINSSNNAKIDLQGSNDPYIRFREGSTEKAYIQWHSSGFLQFVNQESGEYLRIKSGANGLTFTHDGTESAVFHHGNDGSGSGLDADTLDGVQGSSYLRSDAADTFSNALTFSQDNTDVVNFSASSSNNNRGISFNGRTALSASTNAWLRLNNNSEFTNGVYTPGLMRADGGFQARSTTIIGDGTNNLAISFNNGRPSTGVGHNATYHEGIFWHTNSNYGIYRTSGNWSGNFQQLRIDWPTGIILDGGSQYGQSGVRYECHALPSSNNTYDLGTTSLRWRNIYTNDLNLSNEGGANDVDGTWGNFTIQEGEDDLFLINRRNGKKYKFNLTEVQ